MLSTFSIFSREFKFFVLHSSIFLEIMLLVFYKESSTKFKESSCF